jgi:hypothetical protein
MSKDDLMKKWAPIIDSMGVTGSKADWLSQYAQMQSNNESKIEENTLASDTTEFPSLLPIAMKIASKTVGLDLVSVKPLANPGGMSQEEIDRINNEVKKENRDGKIDALIEGKDFKEIKPEEHPDWKPGPVGNLMYMDFKYGSQNEKEEDESPIKGRRGPRKKKN